MTEAAPLRSSRGRDVWLQFKSHKGALLGCGFFVFILCFVTIGPAFWTIDPQFIDIRARNSGMSLAHPLGTDQLGRDMLARLMVGGRTSVAVGIAAMLLSLLIGSLIGNPGAATGGGVGFSLPCLQRAVLTFEPER